MKLSRTEVYMLCDNKRVPQGCFNFNWTENCTKLWVCSLLARNNSCSGTGTQLLNEACKIAFKRHDVDELFLGTQLDNLPMLNCAIGCGFKIAAQDKNGYILRKPR